MKPAIQAFLSLCFGLCLVLAVLPRDAAAQTPEQRLQSIFDKYLNDRKADIALRGNELRTEGSVTVEKTGAYYAVTLPHISYHEKDGAYTDLGITAINVVAGDAPGTWKMSIAMPSPILSYDAQKQPLRRIDVEKQIVSGVWDEALESFSKLDARYQSITFEHYPAKVRATTPAASILYDFTNANNRWSGKASYAMNDLVIQSTDSAKANASPTLKLGKMGIDMTVRDYDAQVGKTYKARIQDIITKRAASDAPNIVSENELNTIQTAFGDFLANAIGEFSQRVYFNGFELNDPASMPDAKKITIASGDVSFSGNNFRADKSNIGLDLNYAGLSIIPASGASNPTIPDRMKIDIDLSNIPLKDLSATIQKFARDPSQQDPATKNAALMALLKNAGTILKLSPSTIGNAHYTIDGNGVTTASTTSPTGIEGTTQIDIRGIDAVIKLAQGKVTDKNLDAGTKMHYTRMAVALATLKMVGQQSPGDKDKRTYVLDMTPDGKFLINGSDISMLQDMLMKSKAEPTPQSPQ